MRTARAVLVLMAIAACTNAKPPRESEQQPAMQVAMAGAPTPPQAVQPAERAVNAAPASVGSASRHPATPAPDTVPAMRPPTVSVASPADTDTVSAVTTGRVTVTVPTDSLTTAPIVVSADPNSVRVVAIPVPAELHGNPANFQFATHSSFNILGRLSGAVTAADSARPLALSVALPGNAAAGRTPVGVMRFACTAGCTLAVNVPVVLDVTARDALRLDPARTLAGAAAGSRVNTDVIITNTGNAPADVSLTVQPPGHWVARVMATQPLRLAAGATATVATQLTIAHDASVGDYPVEFAVNTPGGAVARGATIVHVDNGVPGVLPGAPVLVANAAMARDATQTLPAVSGDLAGNLWPGVRATGHVSYMDRQAMQSSLAPVLLNRLGMSSANSYLRLDGSAWNASAGNVGITTPGLWGSSLWGTGGTFSSADSTWKTDALAVHSPLGGQYLLGSASRNFGPFWGGALVSDLHDDMGGGRSARTVAADFTLPWQQGALSVQAGDRSTDAGSGAAVLANFNQRTRDWSFSANASHIPGGTAAFASAQDALDVYASHQLTSRVGLGGGYWRSSDPGTPGGTSMKSDGWSVAPQIKLSNRTSVSIAGTGGEWTSQSPLGVFGNAERNLRATWIGTLGAFSSQLGASAGTLERSGALNGGVSYTTSAPQAMVFASASTNSSVGVWQLDASSAFTGDGVGVPSQQLSVGVGIDQVPLITNRVMGRAQLLTYHLSGSNLTSTTEILGLEVPLGGGYSLGLDAERSDERRDASGRPLWVMGTRLRRAVGLPPLRSRELRGVVYADLNNSGEQDPGEPGVSSVVVDVDGRPVTTNGRGQFAYDPARGVTATVDPRSLPPGWIAAPRSAQDLSQRGRLAVIPTAAVTVHLRVVNDGLSESSDLHLDRAVLVLTDSTGRRWTGAPSADGKLRFDALPPGMYTVSADLSGLSEPLSLPASLPAIRVVGGAAPIDVTLDVRPRPIRTFVPGGNGGVFTIHQGGSGGSGSPGGSGKPGNTGSLMKGGDE